MMVLISGFGAGVLNTTLQTNTPNALITPIEKEVLEYSYSFSSIKPLINEEGTVLSIDGLDLSMNPGKPIIPVKTAKILIPLNKVVERVEIVASNDFMLPTTYMLPPGQEPVPLSYTGKISRTEPDPVIYNSLSKYPGKLYEIVSLQHKYGFSILYLHLYPIQWVPQTKMVNYYPSFTVKITLATSTNRYAQHVLPDRITSEAIDQIRSFVDNSEVLATYHEQHIQTGVLTGTTLVDPADTYKYVIITNEAMRDASGDYTFQDLIQSKIDKGLSATIITVEDIEACPAYWWDGEFGDGDPLFNDTACHIRNFIKDAYQHWGTQYVLLGGDGDGGGMGENIIPARILYDPIDSSTNSIASDLYYSCLQGSFDSNKNGVFGEPGDGSDIDPLKGEVDLLSEVAVGRAPVDNETELSNFVRKTLAYENTRNDPYLANVLMVGEYLGFGGIASFGGNYKDEIKDGSSNHGYTTAGIPVIYNTSTLYDRDWPGLDPNNPLNTGWPKTEIIERINAGVHIMNHLGHGNNFHVMKMKEPVYMAGGIITGPCHDVENLTNNQFFFLYSQACYAGSFDNRNDVQNGHGEYLPYDCIAESLVTSAHGAFACIANTRYGWGLRYSTNGPSQCFDREFFDALYGENIRSLGWANQDSKEDTLGKLNGDYSDPSYIRYCYYEITLFGDPEVSLQPKHNIGVKSIDVAPHIKSHELTTVNATLGSNGEYDESNVVVRFSVDNVEMETKLIPFFPRCTTQQVSFTWPYPDAGIHTLLVNVTFPGGTEDFSFDNEKQFTVIVGVQNRETGKCYDTIQQAVNDPDTSPGDEIVVPRGLYRENLFITKSISLIGLEKETTIIDGNDAGTVSLEGISGMNITGFTIMNGINGLSLHETSDITLYRTIIRDNTGVGISLSSAPAVHILENDIIGNTIGVQIAEADDTLVCNNHIVGNGLGLQITGESAGTLIYHNMFENTQNALDESSSDNQWDNGYYNSSYRISGGNWWSDDDDNDLFLGPGQNITGSDGILDHPYPIPGPSNAFDRYPLKEPWIGPLMMTIYVDDDNVNGPWQGTSDYPYQHIQDGLNTVVAGDTVFVRNGTYAENIMINKTVHLVGENQNTTIISGRKESSSVSISADGVTIRGFTVQSNGTITADIVINSNNTLIVGNIIRNNSAGIVGQFSHNNITGNIITNTNIGIYLTPMDNSIISKNSIKNNYQGIFSYHSEKILIEKNNISQNAYGIYIPYSDNNTITGNNMIENDNFGICLSYSNGNIVSNNTFSNNKDTGILLYLYSHHNDVFENTISHNGYGRGNYLSGVSLFSSNNSLYHNSFINNYQQVVNNGRNLWNKSYPFGGNYWSDYAGIDIFSGPGQNISGNDGIGDTPYNISGGLDQDYYPLMKPWVGENLPPYPPSNPHPVNGTTNVSLSVVCSWTGGDPDPEDIVTYDVYFGTSSPPPKKVSNHTGTTYDPGTLSYEETYYWKIVAWDNYSALAEGSIWHFNTLSQPDTIPPTIMIIKPKAGYLYISDKEIRKRIFSSQPLILGPITIEVNASDNESSVKSVAFFIDDTLKTNDTTAPYTYLWDQRLFSFKPHTITVVAYDNAGNHAGKEMSVWKFL